MAIQKVDLSQEESRLREELGLSSESFDVLLKLIDRRTDRPYSPEDVLLSMEDVAAMLQVSIRTLDTIVALGEIRVIWVRGQRRFTRKAIEAYVDAQTDFNRDILRRAA